MWRFCLDCGLQKNYHGHAKLSTNTWIVIDKVPHIVCKKCGRLAKAHQGHGTSYCEDCWINDVQPRLEAHANPVVPNPATVTHMQHMGETWVSNYSTPYDVVQSAIRVGISDPSTLATHQKWDLNGKELMVDGKPTAEEKNLIWNHVSKGQDSSYEKTPAKVPDVQKKELIWNQTSIDQGFTYRSASMTIACDRSGRSFHFKQDFAQGSTFPQQDQQKVLGPAAAFNRPVTRAYRPKDRNLTNPNPPPESLPTSTDIEVGAAGPGPSTLSASAKLRPSSEPILSVEKQKLAIPQYEDDADMEMKAGCAFKISLPVRSFSTKPAPPKCEISGNSGTIIARNYFKASLALIDKDPQGRLGWYKITKTQALTTVADLRDLREKDLTIFQIQSIHCGKRKARDLRTLDAAVGDGAFTSHDRRKKRRVEFESEGDGNGISDHRSSSPKSSKGGDHEDSHAKALATIPAQSISSKKRKHRSLETSVVPKRRDSLGLSKRGKRCRIDENSNEEGEGFPNSEKLSQEVVTPTNSKEPRAKALATQSANSEKSTTRSKQCKAHNASKVAGSESFDNDEEWEGFSDSNLPSPEPVTQSTLEKHRAKAPATQGSRNEDSATRRKKRKAYNAMEVPSSEIFDVDDEREGLPDSPNPSPAPAKTTTPEQPRIKAPATPRPKIPTPSTNPRKRKATAPPSTVASYKSAFAHFHIPLVENRQKKRRVEVDSDDSLEGFGPVLGELEPAFEGYDTSDTEVSSGTEAFFKEDRKNILRAKALAMLKGKGKKGCKCK